MVNKRQYELVNKYIEAGKSQAELVVGGHRHESEGNYIPPTIFKNPPKDASIYKEEIFGPVLCVQTFSDEAEAISRANDSEFGLAGESLPFS